MKRLSMLLVIFALAAVFTGCKPVVEETDVKKEYRVYASFYPVYALSRLIIDENIPDMQLYQLVQPQDGCLRSYSLSDWDLYLAANADCVILNGSGLESFEAGLRSLGEDGPAVISATGSMVLLRNEEIQNEESHFYGANPWMFLSVDGALEMTYAICANMQTLDPLCEEAYLKNLMRAEKKLLALKAEMEAILADTNRDTPVAVAHEGIFWLCDEWDLNCVSVIERESGVMPEQGEIQKILEDIAASGAKAVLLEKQAPSALVYALKNAGCEVVMIDTMSSGSAQNASQGYFDAMLQNARNLKNALS